jgi:hypothetical protein
VRIALLFPLVLAAACVERKLHIRTEPEGAMVQVNGRDVGRSPATWRFSHYGTVRVTAYLEGHYPEHRDVRLKAPWYQYPVADFFADLIVPTKIHDDHQLSIALTPVRDRTKEENLAAAAELGRNAVALRTQMEEIQAKEAAERKKKPRSRPAARTEVDYE